MSEDKCVTVARGPIGSDASATAEAEPSEKGELRMPMVGREAPDFEVSAYVDGGFENIKLSDYRGKWVVLCFYPGDFTFV